MIEPAAWDAAPATGLDRTGTVRHVLMNMLEMQVPGPFVVTDDDPGSQPFEEAGVPKIHPAGDLHDAIPLHVRLCDATRWSPLTHCRSSAS